MKVIVIGYGSAGKRFIQILSKINGMEISVCTKRNYDNFLKTKKCTIIKNLHDTNLKDFDFGIISNETSFHLKTALYLTKYKIPFLLEKPISNKINDVKKLLQEVRKNNLITLMGCNLRFHPCIIKIKELLMDKKIGKILSVKVENGSYLPDWHPDENYAHSYASKKILGGGVLFTSIHEIDYLYWFFGNVQQIKSITRKLSNLQIDTDDLSTSIMVFKNDIICELHLDFFQQYPSRSCKIIGDKGIIYWDMEINSVKIYNSSNKKWKKELSLKNFTMDYTYKKEINYFINCLKKHKKTINPVDDGFQVLQIALAILRSSNKNKTVQL